MNLDPVRQRRRSIRLRGWDYAGAGVYFITLCAHDRAEIFGAVTQGEMRPNEFGRVAAECWAVIPDHFPRVVLDAFVVMPNHLHGILMIAPPMVGAQHAAPLPAPPPVSNMAPPPVSNMAPSPVSNMAPSPASNMAPPPASNMAPLPASNVAPGSLGAIVRAYKSAVTKRINEIHATPGARVWQRNYYEHIIRDEHALDVIRAYILNNPRQWRLDRNNPGNLRRLPPPATGADYLADLE